MLTWEITPDDEQVARSVGALEAGSNGDSVPYHYEVWQGEAGTFIPQVCFPNAREGDTWEPIGEVCYDAFQAIAACQAHHLEQQGT